MRLLTPVLLLASALCLVWPSIAKSVQDPMLDLSIDSAERALEQGRYATAEELFLSAISRAEALGPSNDQLERSLKGLAAVYRAQGRPALAEPLLRKLPGSREPIRLDSRDLDPKYRKYFEDVRRMIKDKLRYPCVKEQAQCNYKATQLVVDFGIGKDGSVPHVFVSTPSEFEVYNETVVADIRMAAPFPPLPQQVQDERPVLPLRLTINYSFTQP